MHNGISVFHWLQNMQQFSDFLENTQLPAFDPTQGLVPETNEALGTLGVGADGKSCSEIVGKCFQYRVPMLSGWRKVQNPRQETYCNTIYEFAWPTLKLKSVSSALVILHICIFVAAAIVGTNKSTVFLSISQQSLETMRAMVPMSVYRGHIYRCLMSVFLHSSFTNFFVETIGLLVVCSRIQYTFGAMRTLALYICAGISGNLIQCCITENPFVPSIGSLSTLFGLAGTHIGYLVLNWKGLQFLGRMLRYHLMGLMLFNASFGAALALAVASPADVGQTGGAVTGFLLAATLPTIVDDKSNKRMRWIFFGLAGLINIAAIIVVLCVVGRHYI